MVENKKAEEREYTEQELVAIRNKTISYFKDQQLVLKEQCVVEELKARIKKAQFESFEYTIKMMQLNQAVQEEEDETEKSSSDHDIDKND